MEIFFKAYVCEEVSKAYPRAEERLGKKNIYIYNNPIVT